MREAWFVLFSVIPGSFPRPQKELSTKSHEQTRRTRTKALLIQPSVRQLAFEFQEFYSVTCLQQPRALLIFVPQMKADSPLPSFPAATLWLNHAPDPRALKGHPTLVHFLSLHSEIDRLNLSHVTALRVSRKHEGFRVIGVIVPITEAEESTQFASESIARLNLTEPCALDVDHNLRKVFETKKESLPIYYLFDINGRLQCVSTGEQGVMTIEDELDRMLVELRQTNPFCPSCELFLDRQAMFCSECGIPLSLPGAKGSHPYYENHHVGSLPTVRLANPDPLIGKVIDGKYELVAKLGEGGMSVVYRARRAHIGDDVAVKILTGKFVKDDAALARFRREARAAAMLRHPNVITIHDFGETEDDHAPAYIVMEFVRGTPLRELLKSEDRFSVERALRLMRGICAGVSALSTKKRFSFLSSSRSGAPLTNSI